MKKPSLSLKPLKTPGYPSSNISMVSPRGDAETDRTTKGAGVGGVGGVGGLLAGLGAGWLSTTLIGVGAGGVANGLIDGSAGAGIDERDAHVYAEGIRRGGTLVTARVDETQADAARGILGKSGVDTSIRRSDLKKMDGPVSTKSRIRGMHMQRMKIGPGRMMTPPSPGTSPR